MSNVSSADPIKKRSYCSKLANEAGGFGMFQLNNFLQRGLATQSENVDMRFNLFFRVVELVELDPDLFFWSFWRGDQIF
uniref:Uncharacterized protein n=1 Tax=Picea glauca TaxID=3330 RepID=A0A101M238_PICGL|nr:hypothetical protein ABT39_MTgene2810 [Picea glauca]QHR87657.1 hypothetical protein Q903MT_gene1669 [Picea sitchensis]